MPDAERLRNGRRKLTSGYLLPARCVIHAVGPAGRHGEAELLANCYRRSLKLAAERNLTSITFPNISTGVYGYPKDKVSDVATITVREFMEQPTTVQTVVFVCFDAENYRVVCAAAISTHGPGRVRLQPVFCFSPCLIVNIHGLKPNAARPVDT